MKRFPVTATVAILIAGLVLFLVMGCAQTDVSKAWSECLALGGSPKFMVTESIRQAECKR